MINRLSINPMIKLQVLSDYMKWWVDHWPYITMSFEQFFYNRRPEHIPGTKEHARALATHCYYCFVPLHKEGDQAATIDHFEPASKMQTEKYVICCYRCNQYKGNTRPEALIRQIAKAELTGRSFWGFSGPKFKRVAERIRSIYNDRLWKMGPNIYYVRK